MSRVLQPLQWACGLLAAAVIAAPLMAQEPKAKAAARPRMVRVVSPEVRPDRTVTFRLRAPQAKEVKVSGEFGAPGSMTKGEDGVWSLTVGPPQRRTSTNMASPSTARGRSTPATPS